jgi:hypothetical protein
MAKDKLTDYDATAGNNTDIGGISVDEGMLPSNVNNAIREIMSHLKDFAAGTQAVDAVAINGDLTVDTNTLVVDSTNNRVGIGDTSPTSKLDLGSDVGSSVTDVTNHIGLFGSLYGFGVTSNQLNYVSGDAHVFYNTAGNERVRILGTGGLTFNGDTAAANALDSYEEGSFSPTYTASSSNPTVGYSNQIGRYVKIGQLVHCSIRITTSSVSGGSGALFISGLPFVAESVSNMYSTFSIAYSATWNSDVAPQTGFAIQGGTSIQLLRNSGNISFTPIATGISVSNMVGEGNDIIGAITYRTSA